MADTTSGRGSRAVFVFTSGKVPLTKFMSGGDMAVHHEIENRVNAFLQKPK